MTTGKTQEVQLPSFESALVAQDLGPVSTVPFLSAWNFKKNQFNRRYMNCMNLNFALLFAKKSGSFQLRFYLKGGIFGYLELFDWVIRLCNQF